MTLHVHILCLAIICFIGDSGYVDTSEQREAEVVKQRLQAQAVRFPKYIVIFSGHLLYYDIVLLE